MTKSSLWKLILLLGAVIVGTALVFPKAFRGKPEKITPVQTQKDISPYDVSQYTIEADIEYALHKQLTALSIDIGNTFQAQGIRTSVPVALGIEGKEVAVTFKTAADETAGLAALKKMPIALGDAKISSELSLDIKNNEALRYEIRFADAAIAQITDQTLARTMLVLRKRIDPKRTINPTLKREGNDQILLQIRTDVKSELLESIPRKITVPANMSYHVAYETDLDEMKACAEDDICPQDISAYLNPYNEGYIFLEEPAVLTGDSLKTVEAGIEQHSGRPIINFSYNYDGSTKFCNFTKEHINQQFAVVINKKVVAAPTIRGPICGGSGYIEGGFTMNEAAELALLLNAGAMPTKLRVIEQSIVTINPPANTKE